MNVSGIISEQLGIMFLLILFGYLLVKKEVLDTSVTKQIASMLTTYITPTILIMSFQQDYEWEQLKGLFITMGTGFLLIGSRIAVNRFVLKKEERIDRYAAIFSNSAFVGIPLVMAVLGYEGVFYMTAYMTATTLSQWTYGIYTLSGDRNLITPRKAIFNPATIGAIIGLTLYVLQIKLPFVVSEALYTIGNLNTPLAMVLLGSYVARSKLLEVFTSLKAYWVSLLRLVILPIVGLGILWLLPIDDYLILMVLSIASCAPIAVNTALFSQIYGGDYEYGARLVILSTSLSIITMPLILMLSDFVFKL
ncbi:MAG: AEC family transporter [Carnobacterium sp.]|uniref:AEC family transporter n=1 Tax=Carnobacterium sp. TaxID=48221 RepID=UPI002FCBD735